MADGVNNKTQPTLAVAQTEPTAVVCISPDLWRGICEASFDLVFVIDQSGHILFANAACANAIGVEPKELIRMSIHDVVEEAREESNTDEEILHTSSMAQLLQNGLVRGQSLNLVTVSGENFPVLLSSSPVDIDGKGTRGAVCIAKDVRDLKSQERQVQQLRERVNQSILGSMTEVAGGIAHEVNNPLAVITGRLRALEKNLKSNNPDLPAALSAITNMQAHASRISFVVSALRTLCRNGAEDPKGDYFSTRVILDVIGLFQDRAAAANIRIEHSSPVDSILSVQLVQFKQALFQLISNAITAASNSPAPWIRIESNFSSEGQLQISVTDCGSGIPSQIHEKIFHPFFSTQELGKGQGIGLSTARAAIIAQGGQLTLDRTSFNTRFLITLPAKKVASEPNPQVTPKAS